MGNDDDRTAELKKKLASFSPEKRALFLKLAAEQAAGKSSAPRPMEPQPRAAGVSDFPATFSQERYFLQERASPTIWNRAFLFRLKGRLNRPALERGLNGLVARHEPLRTCFALEGNEIRQRIHPARDVALAVEDLTGLPAAERDPRLAALAQEELARPFNLAEAPMFRTRLLQLEDELHVLLWIWHHSIVDGWSGGIMTMEFAHLYTSTVANRQPVLEPPKLQVADFAVWERERFAGPALAEKLAFWKEHLAGVPTRIALPLKGPARKGERVGRTSSVPIPEALVKSMRERVKEAAATDFVFLLSALSAVLSRWTGQDDLPYGLSTANRRAVALEMMVGPLTNKVMVRVRAPHEQTLGELLTATKTSYLATTPHHDCPYQKLVEAMAQSGAAQQTALHNVDLRYQSFPKAKPWFEGLEVQIMPQTRPSPTKLDMRFYFDETPAGWALSIDYDPEQIEKVVIEQVLAAFLVTLELVVKDPATRISNLEVI
jgi:hypothetical protein